MIDMHQHAVPPNLPGVGPLSPVLRGSREHVARILREQMEEAGITVALGMGSLPGHITVEIEAVCRILP